MFMMLFFALILIERLGIYTYIVYMDDNMTLNICYFMIQQYKLV